MLSGQLPVSLGKGTLRSVATFLEIGACIAEGMSASPSALIPPNPRPNGRGLFLFPHVMT